MTYTTACGDFSVPARLAGLLSECRNNAAGGLPQIHGVDDAHLPCWVYEHHTLLRGCIPWRGGSSPRMLLPASFYYYPPSRMSLERVRRLSCLWQWGLTLAACVRLLSNVGEVTPWPDLREEEELLWAWAWACLPDKREACRRDPPRPFPGLSLAFPWPVGTRSLSVAVGHSLKGERWPLTEESGRVMASAICVVMGFS